MAIETLVANFASSNKWPQWLEAWLQARMPAIGATDAKDIERFLRPSLRDLPDPFSLQDMREAAELVADAIEAEGQIAIYGDYDVDGTVGTALLRRFFRSLGIDPIVYQPDRAKEGYGVNAAAMDKLAERGTELLITVDCGITNNVAIARARELGMEVVICDHHEPAAELPPATAILDHKRKDETSSIRSLCGTGVAFYLMMAVRSVLRERGLFADAQAEPDLKQWLDLVAVATIADMVPLVAENRILATAGLEKLRRSPLPGLRELFQVAGAEIAEAGTYHVGFVVGPRINASGRLGSAGPALDLLTTDDIAEAKQLAADLQIANDERRGLQEEVVASALAQAKEQIAAQADIAGLVLFADDWHEGVIGIAAARVVEEYRRPVAMITFHTQTGAGKGSLRSFGKIDLVAALNECANLLLGYGGHKAAAGMSIARENIAEFRKSFALAIAKNKAELPEVNSLEADCEFPQKEKLYPEHIELLDKLGPFGIGYPEPQFLFSQAEILEVKILKEVHIKLQLRLASGQELAAFWPKGANRLLKKPGEKLDIVACPQVNNFRGKRTAELKIKDAQ